MRCSICGAPLKKEGDICSNCYKEYQEDEDLKKDVNETLKVKRKYSITYEFARYIGIIIVFLIVIVTFFMTKAFLEGFLSVLIFLIVMGFLLFVDKRIANGTRATFYEKKVKYKYKFLFIKKNKTIKYKDIKDITYYQTLRQKRYGYGDLCVYAKGSIPGATLLNGFQIKDVENVEEVMNKLREIITIEE
jgi:hypothetical protein